MEPVDPADGGGDPPVISLQEVRKRRQQEAERAERNRQANVLRAHQQEAITEAIMADRLPSGEILDMIRLGIVTDSPERLPCEEWQRDEDYYDWVLLADNLEGAEERRQELMQPRYPNEPEQIRRERAEPAERHRVQCPLMSAIYFENQPPCIEAIREQAENGPWGVEVTPIDPEDPLVKYEVRPCVLIGHHALVGMMRPVWDREEEE